MRADLWHAVISLSQSNSSPPWRTSRRTHSQLSPVPQPSSRYDIARLP